MQLPSLFFCFVVVVVVVVVVGVVFTLVIFVALSHVLFSFLRFLVTRKNLCVSPTDDVAASATLLRRTLDDFFSKIAVAGMSTYFTFTDQICAFFCL